MQPNAGIRLQPVRIIIESGVPTIRRIAQAEACGSLVVWILSVATSFVTFERLKDKGIAAYKKGEYTTAKTYLVEAAESMIEIAEQAKSPDMRRQHEEYATELIDLATDCEAQRKNRSPRLQRATDPEDTVEDTS